MELLTILYQTSRIRSLRDSEARNGQTTIPCWETSVETNCRIMVAAIVRSAEPLNIQGEEIVHVTYMFDGKMVAPAFRNEGQESGKLLGVAKAC